MADKLRRLELLLSNRMLLPITVTLHQIFANMKLLCTLLCFASFLTTVRSGDTRYETATGTNSITIGDYESAELISVLNTNALSPAGHAYYVVAKKNGYTFSLKSAAAFLSYSSGPSVGSGVGDTIRGPATFSLMDVSSAQGFTLKITPVSFPPNLTLIVPPGTNQVQISMESSTNLVNWATATNGVYGSPDEARFFRLKMTNLQP